MKTLELASSLFWLLVSLVFIAASVHLGTGSVHNPGMGFITFWAAGILGVLSLALFVKALFEKEVSSPDEPLFGKTWPRAVIVLTLLIVYSVFMPKLGYLISTFVLMSLLFWILEKGKIGFVFLYAALSTFVTYQVFSKWLNCQFPDGFFGF